MKDRDKWRLHFFKRKGLKKMLQCPKQTLARLFYNLSSTCLLLFIIFHFTSIFLAKLFLFFGGNPFDQRSQDGYEVDVCAEDEMGEETENFVMDDSYNPIKYELCEESMENDEQACYGTPASEEVVAEEVLARDADDSSNEAAAYGEKIVPKFHTLEGFSERHDKIHVVEGQQRVVSSSFRQEESFLIFMSQGKKLVQEKDECETFEDSFTVGSTSKDSSEWRSSIKTEDDPFSFSSRRSCPKWESYTIFQKYDEEMLFLDRISAQKLQETESLKSIHACPRSISERIVYKLRTRSSQKRSEFRTNPYHELESAYVSQICLTWEALNWNHKHVQRLRASRKEFDPGCLAYVAQQFQQFQVLLQRYVENEPYEHGTRPEIYARMRTLAPKLLQVPEYRDTVDERGEGHSSRIPSSSFRVIMEDSIRAFMSFLKQDKKSHRQILADMFRRTRRSSADATLLILLKKVNKKKKSNLNDLRRRSGNCLRKRKLSKDEDLELLMASIDLKVVSRVLRMAHLNGAQLQWCERKMSKVGVSDGKLHRDSSPLFFPAH